MILNLKKAFITDNFSLPIGYELDLGDIDFSGVYPLKTPVKISGEVYSRAGVVYLKIRCAVTYEAPCDRCGEISCEHIDVDNEYILATEIENEDNDNIILVNVTEFDLDELCRTDVLLHIPMKHLCRSDCKGLCPECGKNLNDGPCNCGKKSIDPRFAALAELLEEN